MDSCDRLHSCHLARIRGRSNSRGQRNDNDQRQQPNTGPNNPARSTDHFPTDPLSRLVWRSLLWWRCRRRCCRSSLLLLLLLSLAEKRVAGGGGLLTVVLVDAHALVRKIRVSAAGAEGHGIHRKRIAGLGLLQDKLETTLLAARQILVDQF